MGLMHLPGNIEIFTLYGVPSTTVPVVSGVWRKNPRARFVVGIAVGRGGNGGDGAAFSGAAVSGGGGGSGGLLTGFKLPAFALPDILFVQAANAMYATPPCSFISADPRFDATLGLPAYATGSPGNPGGAGLTGFNASGGAAPSMTTPTSGRVPYQIGQVPAAGSSAGNVSSSGSGQLVTVGGSGSGGGSTGTPNELQAGGAVSGSQLYPGGTYAGGAAASNGQDALNILDAYGLPLERLGGTGGGSNYLGVGGNGGSGLTAYGAGGGGGGAGIIPGTGGWGGPGAIFLISTLE